MYSCRRTFLAFLMVTGVARAGAVVHIELVPSPPANPGGYLPGETLDVAVHWRQNTGVDIPLRMVSHDFQLTDAAIELISFDFGPMWQHHQSVCGSHGLCGEDHLVMGSVQEVYKKVDAVFIRSSTNLASQVIFPSEGFLHAGVLTIGLPTSPGTFILDSARLDSTDDNLGARLDFGFILPRTTWSVATGDFSGGTLIFESHAHEGSFVFNAIPEPATLALLGIGGLAILRRRRSALLTRGG